MKKQAKLIELQRRVRLLIDAARSVERMLELESEPAQCDLGRSIRENTYAATRKEN